MTALPPARIALIILAGAALVKLWLAAGLDFGLDEAYAITVATPAQLSWFDHPPMVFWIAGGIDRLVGHAATLPIRLPFILLSLLTAGLIWRLTDHLYGARAALWALVCFAVAPAMLVGGLFVLPDGPLEAALAAGALALALLLFPRADRPPVPAALWLIVGACLGLALLSKYQAVILAAGAGAFLLADRASRRWLTTPWPYAAAALALVLALPVVLWNAGNGWASIAFQAGRAAGPSRFTPLPLLQLTGGLMAYLLPWLLIGVISSIIRAGRGRDRRDLFLLSLAVPLPALMLAVALGGSRVLPHWPVPGLIFAFPLLGAALARLEAGSSGIPRAMARWSIILMAALALAAPPAVLWLKHSVATSAASPNDNVIDALRWSPVAPPEIMAAAGRGETILVWSWRDGARVADMLPAGTAITVLGPDGRGFGPTRSVRPAVSRDGLLVSRPAQSAALVSEAGRYFAGIGATVTLPRDAAAGRPFDIDLTPVRGLKAATPVP